MREHIERVTSRVSIRLKNLQRNSIYCTLRYSDTYLGHSKLAKLRDAEINDERDGFVTRNIELHLAQQKKLIF